MSFIVPLPPRTQFIIGPAVINTHTCHWQPGKRDCWPRACRQEANEVGLLWRTVDPSLLDDTTFTGDTLFTLAQVVLCLRRMLTMVPSGQTHDAENSLPWHTDWLSSAELGFSLVPTREHGESSKSRNNSELKRPTAHPHAKRGVAPFTSRAQQAWKKDVRRRLRLPSLPKGRSHPSVSQPPESRLHVAVRLNLADSLGIHHTPVRLPNISSKSPILAIFSASSYFPWRVRESARLPAVINDSGCSSPSTRCFTSSTSRSIFSVSSYFPSLERDEARLPSVINVLGPKPGFPGAKVHLCPWKSRVSRGRAPF